MFTSELVVFFQALLCKLILLRKDLEKKFKLQIKCFTFLTIYEQISRMYSGSYYFVI